MVKFIILFFIVCVCASFLTSTAGVARLIGFLGEFAIIAIVIFAFLSYKWWAVLLSCGACYFIGGSLSGTLIGFMVTRDNEYSFLIFSLVASLLMVLCSVLCFTTMF